MSYPILASTSAVARCVLGGACVAMTLSAQASPFELIYSGYLNTTEALNLRSAVSPTFFAADTPFTFNARFDNSTPNLAPTFPPAPPPFGGYRAYAPSSMTIDIQGQRFSISVADNPLLTVSIFDRGSFDPGHYAVGFIVDAPGDGAGIIGDFLSASPNFVVSALTPTTFGDYVGVGHASGLCSSGSPPECPHQVTPLVLRDASQRSWNLTLGNYELDPPNQALNSARIVAVPEPTTYGLMLAGLGGLMLAKRSRRRES